ncbi:MAG TPA: hypothetical protein VGQ53_24545 [Chitinophagaceae bacterium]|nr:hypothetical protein [Chitinophagaceae bacterium]
MKKFLLAFLATAMCLVSLPAFSQDKEKVDTTNKLGLAGDGLDLYAVLDLFQQSKTIESFEKSLNDPKTKINNLDLDLDKKVDFIKVVTEKKDKKDDSYMFILRVDVSKTESQDVAVILLDRDKDKKVSLQMVGDEELYGKDYVIEPKGNSPVTPNPAYKGADPVTVTVEAQPTTVVVQQAPVVQYVYSPAYVPYYPPYYYGYYPGWFAFTAVVSFGFYAAAWGGHHHGYYGGHYHGGNNNVIINNNNNFNNYNNNKMRSNDVRNNQNRGNYGNGSTDRRAGDRASASTRPANSNRPSASTRDAASNRGGASNRAGTGGSVSNRQSTSPSNRSSSFNSPSTRSSSSSFGGGGRSMGGGGGGRSFGGGGGGRRR